MGRENRRTTKSHYTGLCIDTMKWLTEKVMQIQKGIFADLRICGHFAFS